MQLKMTPEMHQDLEHLLEDLKPHFIEPSSRLNLNNLIRAIIKDSLWSRDNLEYRQRVADEIERNGMTRGRPTRDE